MDFYKIDEEYIQFLQNYEKKYRGFSKVPNIKYLNRNKFAFGAVLSINEYNYYVALSSFDKKQEANILIRIPGDKKEIKGSLRFNYMIPVPRECLEKLIIKNIKDDKYRNLLNKEFDFCIKNSEKIIDKAYKIYNMVTNNKKQILTDNSCDFKLLEEGYKQYICEKKKRYRIKSTSYFFIKIYLPHPLSWLLQ